MFSIVFLAIPDYNRCVMLWITCIVMPRFMDASAHKQFSWEIEAFSKMKHAVQTAGFGISDDFHDHLSREGIYLVRTLFSGE